MFLTYHEYDEPAARISNAAITGLFLVARPLIRDKVTKITETHEVKKFLFRMIRV